MAEEGDVSADALQFERAERAHDAASNSTTIACSSCAGSIAGSYFTLGKAPLCTTCKGALEARSAAANRWRTYLLAAGAGLVAAVIGAVLYYAVIAITDYEIGIVAILIGYMVGWAVRKGSGGWGGLRYQVLALVLTYFAVGLAYTPLAFAGMEKSEGAAAADSAEAKPVASGDSAAATARAPSDSLTGTVLPSLGDSADATSRESAISIWGALGALALLTFALPVMSVVSSMPGGLLSAAIIGFGMRQAWQMTRAPDVQVRGPYMLAPPNVPTVSDSSPS